ncbi:hypothetical protein E4U43_004845 [Claviceps pusilla]|uniref:Uncharacterized protein n=1 Tax=Claviceps pusilla TaxID=123648 RepID=A0A9P7STP7_9HYPO|nr:hypothetical protein E4U43_004845 [Claviceps pusilla]
MAPPNGSVKGRKAGIAAHHPKPVVPALPLTYAKLKPGATGKVASVTSSTTSASASTSTSTSSVTEVHSPSSQAQSRRPGANSYAQKAFADSRGDPTAATSHDEIASPSPSESSTKEVADSSGQASTGTGHHSHNLPSSEEAMNRISPTISAESQNNNHHGSHAERLPSARHVSIGRNSSRADPKSETLVNSSAPASKTVDHPSDVVKGAGAAKDRPPPAVSPSRYQIPPPFQPASRPYGIMTNGDVVCGPRPPMPNGGAAHAHHSHPSNDSIHFGTFQDSQNTSPVPLHSGGIMPPPPMPMVDGRTPYMPPSGNGFPPMMPYGADMMQPANFDHYGRPAMGFGPMDAFPIYGNNFGPSTPHSFHDSQSSGQPEENAIYHTYPANGHRNGGAGAGPGELEGQGPAPAPTHTHNHSHTQGGRIFVSTEYADPRMIQHGPGPLPPLIPHDHSNGDGLVEYMQQHFGDSEFADCTLELRYVDDRAAPVRIPGHRLIFARSRVLGALLRNQTLHLTSERNSHTLLLETGDKWLRSDSFYTSVQRLYGLPLLPLPLHVRPDSSPSLADAGTTSDQLDFALSYAAAGHLLEWASIVRRGCEVATRLLSWHSMDKMMEFALEGHIDNGSGDLFKYGDGSKIILSALVTFIVHHLPPTFTLDVSSTDPKRYARLPDHPPPPPPAAAESSIAKQPATIIARGSSVQFGKGCRSQPIRGIQFGDLSMGEEIDASESETPKATQQAQPVETAVLSRTLINLPFSQLKMVLESASSGNVHGWANAELRYRIVRNAVEEREARRLRALDAVVGGRVPDSERIRAALGSPSPQDIGPWSVLGWQEEILPYGNADGPALGRKWVPIFERQKDRAAAYP